MSVAFDEIPWPTETQWDQTTKMSKQDIHAELLRWHPDRVRRWLTRLRPEDHDRAQQRAKQYAQILIKRLQDVKDQEDEEATR